MHIDALSGMLTLFFDKGRKERRKEGRKEGRKERRKEGRKEHTCVYMRQP